MPTNPARAARRRLNNGKAGWRQEKKERIEIEPEFRTYAAGTSCTEEPQPLQNDDSQFESEYDRFVAIFRYCIELNTSGKFLGEQLCVQMERNTGDGMVNVLFHRLAANSMCKGVPPGPHTFVRWINANPLDCLVQNMVRVTLWDALNHSDWAVDWYLYMTPAQAEFAQAYIRTVESAGDVLAVALVGADPQILAVDAKKPKQRPSGLPQSVESDKHDEQAMQAKREHVSALLAPAQDKYQRDVAERILAQLNNALQRYSTATARAARLVLEELASAEALARRTQVEESWPSSLRMGLEHGIAEAATILADKETQITTKSKAPMRKPQDQGVPVPIATAVDPTAEAQETLTMPKDKTNSLGSGSVAAGTKRERQRRNREEAKRSKDASAQQKQVSETELARRRLFRAHPKLLEGTSALEESAKGEYIEFGGEMVTQLQPKTATMVKQMSDAVLKSPMPKMRARYSQHQRMSLQHFYQHGKQATGSGSRSVSMFPCRRDRPCIKMGRRPASADSFCQSMSELSGSFSRRHMCDDKHERDITSTGITASGRAEMVSTGCDAYYSHPSSCDGADVCCSIGNAEIEQTCDFAPCQFANMRDNILTDEELQSGGQDGLVENLANVEDNAALAVEPQLQIGSEWTRYSDDDSGRFWWCHRSGRWFWSDDSLWERYTIPQDHPNSGRIYRWHVTSNECFFEDTGSWM